VAYGLPGASKVAAGTEPASLDQESFARGFEAVRTCLVQRCQRILGEADDARAAAERGHQIVAAQVTRKFHPSASISSRMRCRRTPEGLGRSK
jgi:hypothetical protein